MANRILRGLAVAAGTGLARGVTSGRARVAPPDEVLNIEPLLDRLEIVEARVESQSRFAAEISTRIASMEQALAEQAGSIRALSARAVETDNNLQRLAAAVERLCDRAQPTQLPFESQLEDAMAREPVVPLLRTEDPTQTAIAPEPSIPKKPRFLFR